jgi:outer membrane receptor protein involved in Fe transport
MRRSLIVFLSLIYVAESMAQQTTRLSGTVRDADTELAIEFASVSLLLAADSSLITGAVAGAGGEWELSDVPAEEAVLIRYSFIGYETGYWRVEEPRSSISPIRLHLRTAAQLLREIEVTGRAYTDVHRLDRQAYTADQFQNARGGTASDVIGNLPAVSIDARGEISVRGATGFLLLIDGKPVQSDPATILAQLPANAIESVELITTPGARYDPDGKAGILNIVTRAGSLNGWSAATNLNLGLPAVRDYDAAEGHRRHALDASANYRSKRWDVGMGADYRRDDTGGQRDGYVNTLIGRQLTEFPSLGERSHDRENYSGRLSATFRPTPEQAITAGLLAGKRTVWRTADILYTDQRRALVRAGNLDLEGLYDRFLVTGGVSGLGEEIDRRTYFNENLRVRRGDFLIGSLDYVRELGEGRKLSVSALYERTLLGGPTDNLVLGYPELADTLQYQYNTNDNPLDGYRLNLGYSSKIGETSWQNGYQFRYLRHPGDFLYLDRDLENDRFVINPEFTNGIVLRRDVHAAYSQFGGATERLEYSAGLRLEYFDRSVTLDRPDTTYTLDRFSLYPSANLKYQLSEPLSVKAGYSRRIDRTTTFKMTPFPEREHNETLEQGDAELLPELTDLLELGLIGTFGDHSVFATAYYRHTRDVINRVNTVYNDTILNRIYTNVGNANTVGLELGATVYPTTGWRVYLGGNVYRYGIDGRVFGDDIDVSNWVYSLSATSDMSLWKWADLQVGVNYLSEQVTAQGRDSRFFSPYLNLRREFPEQRLTVTFQWQHISLGLWEANEQRITTVRPDFFTTTNYLYETDILRLGVGYQFTARKRGVAGPRSEFGEAEF